jgi:hypothetical protein
LVQIRIFECPLSLDAFLGGRGGKIILISVSIQYVLSLLMLKQNIVCLTVARWRDTSQTPNKSRTERGLGEISRV